MQVRNVHECGDIPPVSFSKGTLIYKEVKTLKYTTRSRMGRFDVECYVNQTYTLKCLNAPC